MSLFCGGWQLTATPLLMPGYCLNSWQSGTPDWSPGCIWHSSDYIERAIYISFALMLASNVFVVGRFVWRYYYAHRAASFERNSVTNSQQREQKLSADFGRGLRTLKAIASAAPFLGLAGSCYGVLAALYFDYSGSRSGLVALIFARVGAACTTTIAGIIVAIPAVISYNLLRTLTDNLLPVRSWMTSPGKPELGSFHFAQTLPLRRRFSRLPSFAIIAAPALASVVSLFLAFEPYETPTGLAVRLLHIGPFEGDHNYEPVVVALVADGDSRPTIRVNAKEVSLDTLEQVARAKLQRRAEPWAFVEADGPVAWSDVVDVIDRLEGIHCRVILLTATPQRGDK